MSNATEQKPYHDIDVIKASPGNLLRLVAHDGIGLAASLAYLQQIHRPRLGLNEALSALVHVHDAKASGETIAAAARQQADRNAQVLGEGDCERNEEITVTLPHRDHKPCSHPDQGVRPSR